MRDYLRLTGVLLAICIIAAGVLGVTNAITNEKITEQTIKANDEARKEVLGEATQFVKIEGDKMDEILTKPDYDVIDEVFEGKADGKIVGYTIKTSPNGYKGAVEIIIGINKEGKVSGIKVGNNTETPGLGKNAATPKFQEQFKDKDWNKDVKVIKNGTPKDNEILSIAGATVTSNAVAKGVNQALKLAKELSGI